MLKESYKRIFLVNTRKGDHSFSQAFIDEAQKYCVEVILIDLSKLSFCYEPNGHITVWNGVEQINFTKQDFVYIRRAKGERELGNVLGWVLDAINVPFNDKVALLSHQLSNSKIVQSFRLCDIVKSPKTWVMSFGGFDSMRNLIGKKLGYPLILKKDGANGEYVWKIDSEQMLGERIDDIRKNESDKENPALLFQELVPNNFDIRAIVYKGEVLSSIARSAAPGAFHNNISKGGKAEEIILSDEEKNIAIAVTKKLGLDLGGVDLVRTQEGIRLFEVNKSPGLINGIVKDTNVRKLIRRLLVG